MKLIIDIPKEKYNNFMYSDDIDVEELDEAYEYLINGTPIPDNATNEETIRALFPYTIFVENRTTNRIVISKEWWNAPYQKGGKE